MPTVRKLGKRPPRRDRRTLLLSRYLIPAALPVPPPHADWSRGFDIDWSMMLNDSLGCCTEAKKGHAIQCWTLCNGRLRTPPDSVVLAAYEADGGYDPSQMQPDGSNPTDNGEDMISNLNAWRKGGFGGHALGAYAAIDYSSFASVAQAIYLFGLVDIGFNVPQSAMDQTDRGETWDVVAHDGGIVGGHDVIVPAYSVLNGADMFTCITWSRRQRMTWAFFRKYVDEAYCLLSPDWFDPRGLDPNGIDIAALATDLAMVTA